MSVPLGRSRGKLLVIGCIALVAVAVAFGYLAVRDRPEPAAILDILAIDADHAVMIRSVRDQPQRTFISMFARGRGELWGALLPPYISEDGHGAGLAATAEVVAARAASSGGPKIVAFAGQGGRLLGRLSPVNHKPPSSASLVIQGVGALYDQGMVYEIFGDAEGTWAEVLAINVHEGSVQWRSELGSGVLAPAWLRERHLVILRGAEVLVIERESGAIVQRVAAQGRPCVLANVMYVPQASGIREVALGGGQERVIPLDPGNENEGENKNRAFGGLCGHANGRLVLALGAGRGLMAMDTASLAEVWRAAVPTGDGGDVATLFPDAMPLAGELLPYVPVLADSALAMVGIEDGTVRWQSPPGASWARASVWRAGKRYYLYDGDRNVLAVLGGASGTLDAAITLAGCGRVWPDQVAGGHVWLGCGEDWALLDGATLAVVGHSAAEAPVFANARSQLAAELGASR